jgi:UDP-2,3-diacylglucosamine pyrophosphatase LpxH
MGKNRAWPSAQDRVDGRLPNDVGERSVSYHRAIWISDLHLGTRRCKARALLEFLVKHKSEILYLVGDIVDGWNLGREWYWCATQDAVIEEIAKWRRLGGRVALLSGNHDESSTGVARDLLGPVGLVRPHLIHRTFEGRRMLVIHGHQFDGRLNPNRWKWLIGSRSYGAVQRFNAWYSPGGRGEDRGDRTLASLRARVRRAVELATDFRDRAVVKAASEHHADGVICGHIHRAETRMIGDICYINDGDWVHSCSALVEDFDGRLRLVEHQRACLDSLAGESGAVAA